MRETLWGNSSRASFKCIRILFLKCSVVNKAKFLLIIQHFKIPRKENHMLEN